MGKLDEPAFDAAVSGCPSCGGAAVEIHSFIDRRLEVMLAEPNDEGAWAHDGEKFACEACDAATVSKSCALCGAPGPLRVRP